MDSDTFNKLQMRMAEAHSAMMLNLNTELYGPNASASFMGMTPNKAKKTPINMLIYWLGTKFQKMAHMCGVFDDD